MIAHLKFARCGADYKVMGAEGFGKRRLFEIMVRVSVTAATFFCCILLNRISLTSMVRVETCLENKRVDFHCHLSEQRNIALSGIAAQPPFSMPCCTG